MRRGSHEIYFINSGTFFKKFLPVELTLKQLLQCAENILGVIDCQLCLYAVNDLFDEFVRKVYVEDLFDRLDRILLEEVRKIVAALDLFYDLFDLFLDVVYDFFTPVLILCHVYYTCKL